MMDSRPLCLRPEDSAPAPLHAVPDLQELNVRLSDLLARADKAIGDVLDALNHSRDLIDGRRLARIWGSEAQTAITEAIETRESLARAQRGAGMLSAVYTTGPVG